MATVIWQGDKSCLGFEQVTVAGASIGLTASKITTFGSSTAPQRNEAAGAFLTVETGPIRFSLDPATVPTTTVGHLLNAGDTLTVDGKTNLTNLRFIRTTGTSGLVNATYWGS